MGKPISRILVNDIVILHKPVDVGGVAVLGGGGVSGGVVVADGLGGGVEDI